ncbi:MAG: DUF4493 domain-containing protein [Bacteroides sp.]|nr:DUF4493 domain-containing protein [Bacteroides sp.]
MASACSEETEVVRLGASRLIPTLKVNPSVMTPHGEDSTLLSFVPAANDFSLTLKADGGEYSHTWTDFTDYSSSELLRPGSYLMSVAYGSDVSEGVNQPYFAGSVSFNLSSGAELPVTIVAELASAMLAIDFSESLTGQFSSVQTLIHSQGHGYVSYSVANQDDYCFVHPGNLSIALNVVCSDGRQALVELCSVENALARNLYEIKLDCSVASGVPLVSASVNGAPAGSVAITEELLNAPTPEIHTRGFSSGAPVSVTEGDTPAQSLSFEVSQTVASSLLLTTVAPSLTAQGWPEHIDLAKASDAELTRLTDMGLALQRNTQGAVTAVDMTGVVKHLRYSDSAVASTFTLLASAANGKMSMPATLALEVAPVSVSVTEVSNVVIGLNKARAGLICRHGDLQNNLSIETLDESGRWVLCPVESIEQAGNGEWAVLFSVPDGARAEIDVRFSYCGNTVTQTTLRRVAPDYSLDIDAFALSAAIRVKAADASLTPLLVSMMRIYVDGHFFASVRTEPDLGIIYIGPLESNHSYSINSTLLENPSASDFSTPQSIRTERTLQITNGDFEDHEDDIKVKSLPSGGRYSQSIADIFNCQNHRAIETQRPRDWANTNAKTFCRAAKNPNTWYMAPSVMSELDNVEEYFAVKLQSVAWDIDGEQIPDYRQKVGEFLPYNPNVPNIRYRAAGKLFLGDYNFDPATLTETYSEGIAFGSRPVALNGNFRFTPSVNDLSDNGLVRVEVLGTDGGKEVTLAKGELLLPAALTYTAFTVPLSYKLFGIKATRLKIMMSSSRHCGSIEYESSHIHTYNDVLNATSLGGTLWLQDITLSYF